MKKRFNKDKKINSNVRDNWNYYKREIKNAINDLKHKDTFYKQIPNLLTVSRVLGMIPVSILMLTGNTLFGMILLGLVLSTDFFDGKIARKYGLVSKFGADLDAVCDKVMAFLLMIPLIFDAPILILNMVLEGLISFSNVKARIIGVDTKTIFIGKIKTCFLSVTLLLGYLTKIVGFSYNAFMVLALSTMLMQIKTYYDYAKIISIKTYSDNDREIKKDIDNDFEKVKTEDKIDELKKEKEYLMSLNMLYDRKDIKVRKRKK